jgi:hypothetical protein
MSVNSICYIYGVLCHLFDINYKNYRINCDVIYNFDHVYGEKLKYIA